MKINVYDGKVGAPRSPVYSQVADLRSDSFSNVAKTLGSYAEKLDQDNQEALKTEYYKADTAIRYDLEKGYAEIEDRIKNGGAYANAEKEYQKLYDATVAKYGGAFVDPNVKERSMAEYKRMGLGQTLRLKDVVQARRKSDAVSAANNAMDLYDQQYFDATDDAGRAAVLSKVSKTMAGLTAIGVVSPDEAKMKLRKFTAGAEERRIKLLAQDDPIGAMELVEKNRKVLDPDTYVSIRGAVSREVESFASAENVDQYLNGSDIPPLTPAQTEQVMSGGKSETSGKKASPPSAPNEKVIPVKPPKQEDVDQYFQRRVANEFFSGNMTPDQYESSTIELANKTGFIPTPLADQAALFLNMQPENMKDADLRTAASLARIVSEVDRTGGKTKMGLDKNDLAKANLFASRMASGMDMRAAYSSMSMVLSDEESTKVFNSAKTEGRRVFNGLKVNNSTVDIGQIPKQSAGDFIEAYAMYRANQASPSEAAKQAEKDVMAMYGTFNGVQVKDPVTKFDKLPEDKWVAAARRAVFENVGLVNENAKVIVMADNAAKAMRARGEIPSYPVGISFNGEIAPAINPRTGEALRIRGTENVKYYKETKTRRFTKGAGLKTVRKITEEIK